MSLTPDDLIHLPYTDDLTQAGIAHACLSLPHILLHTHRVPISRLRNTVAGIAGELALRRWLEGESIPYALASRTPITKPHRYHLILGGRRLAVICRLVTEPRLVAQLLHDHSSLLQAEALVPQGHLNSEALLRDDVFTFAFMLGRFARPPAVGPGKPGSLAPTHLIALPPKRTWRQPRPWRRLGDLTIENPGSCQLSLILAGQLEDHSLVQDHLEVDPHTVSTKFDRGFHTLIYLHVPSIPDASLRIRLHNQNLSWTVFRSTWKNLWYHGQCIILAGWMTKGEIAHASHRIPAGSRTRLHSSLPSDHLSQSVESLHSMRELVRLI